MTTTKGRKFHPQAYTTAEVEQLIAACSPTSPTGKRNRALIVVLWRGALRCEEALQLKVHDLDRRRGTIRVMHGKGRRARTVAIEPRAWAVLELWLLARQELGVPRSAPVFCAAGGHRSATGAPLSSRYVRLLMAQLGAKAGLEKRVHAHGLRHSRAAEMADEGIPVHMISVALGHSNVGTTDRYILHLGHERQVLDAMLASQWGQDG